MERHWQEHLAQQQAAAAAAAPAGEAPWAAWRGQASARTAAAAAEPYALTPQQVTGPLPAALLATPAQLSVTAHVPLAHQPAASEVAAAAAAAVPSTAASGGSSVAGSAEAAGQAGWLARADSAMQMRLADALVALGEADDQPPSWRRALRKLRLAGKGGATLEVGKPRWAGCKLWCAGGSHVALLFATLQLLTMCCPACLPAPSICRPTDHSGPVGAAAAGGAAGSL